MSFFKYINAPVKNEVKENVIIEQKKKQCKKSFITNAAPSLPKSILEPRQEIKEIVEEIDIESCDILFIDDQIKRKLRKKIELLPLLHEKLKDLIWIINNSPDIVDRIEAKKESVSIRQKIKDIEWGFEYSLYILRSAELIREYKEINNSLRENSFIQTKGNIDEKKIHKKNYLILEYMRIAKNYVNVTNFMQNTQKILCSSCHCDKLSGDVNDNSLLVCKGCGSITEILDDAPTFKDSERVNMAARYTYTCKGHFIEAMNRFEGKQNVDIEDYVIETLKNELKLHNLTEATVTKDHIYMFLSECKLSDFYADINLIFFLVSGSSPPDITDYRNELLDMYDQLQDVYSTVKDDRRLNALNVNWTLYKLLQLLDYKCKKEDFFCLKTPAKQGEHEQTWYEMIEILMKKYPNQITSSGKQRWRHVRTI